MRPSSPVDFQLSPIVYGLGCVAAGEITYGSLWQVRQLPGARYAYVLGPWKMDVIGDTIKFQLFLHCRISAQHRTTSWKSLVSLVMFASQEPPLVPRRNPLKSLFQGSITLHPFISNPIPYTAVDAKLWVRLLAGLTRIERAVAILIAMAKVNEQHFFR